MVRPTVDQDAESFLNKLQEAGGSCGNYNLKNQLGWTDDRYWRTHGIVIDEGLATRGRGKGGSIILIPQAEVKQENLASPAVTTTVGEQAAAIYAKETELYPPSKTMIEQGWSKEKSYDDFVVEVTAQPGRVQTGGTWTRPDVSLLGTKSYPYLPGRFFEIVTFEIKTPDAIDVRGVFEALSHSQFATMAYVVFHTNNKEFKEFPNSDRVVEMAAKHGVGIIAALQMERFETWNEVVEPRRNIFDPEQANQFIGASFSETSRNKILKWQK